jgi:hypothetical protein
VKVDVSLETTRNTVSPTSARDGQTILEEQIEQRIGIHTGAVEFDAPMEVRAGDVSSYRLTVSCTTGYSDDQNCGHD